MSLAVSSSSAHVGQVPVDANEIGIRNLLVSDLGRKVAATQASQSHQTAWELRLLFYSRCNCQRSWSQNHVEKSVENLKELNFSSRQMTIAVANRDEMKSPGICSIVRTEDGVAEFRGPTVRGLVRFAQVNEHESQIEACFDGLTPGSHSWSVNEYGDVRDGAASTGLPYSTSVYPSNKEEEMTGGAGMLGTLMADSKGHAEYNSSSSRLAVWDIIGRSVVLYQSCHRELPNTKDAIACAVIARSSGPRGPGGAVQLCSCDGTVIWQSPS